MSPIRRGPSPTPPDAAGIYYRPSHERARCENGIVAQRRTCEALLYEVPVLMDGANIGRLEWRCPHCHDGKPAPVRANVPIEVIRETEVVTDKRHADKMTPEEWAARRRGYVAMLRRFYKAHGRAPTDREFRRSTEVQPAIPSRWQMLKAFGSTMEGVAAASLPANPTGYQVTPNRTARPNVWYPTTAPNRRYA